MALSPPVENGLRESREIKEGLTPIVGASLFLLSLPEFIEHSWELLGVLGDKRKKCR